MKTTKKPARKLKCINPDCPTRGDVYTRGVCENCYRAIRYKIKKGEMTDADATGLGMWEDRKPAGFKRFPKQSKLLAKRAAATK